MHRIVYGAAGWLALCCTLPARLPAQQPIPVRSLAIEAASDTGILKFFDNVRHLPGGRVLVNDVARRRILMFDARLATFTVVFDNDGVSGNAYGRNAAQIIPYLGDSSIFVDNASASLVVIDPAGRVTRAIAAPGADLYGITGNAGFDPSGRLVYRGTVTRAPAAPSGAVSAPVTIQRASLPILRASVDTRLIDTLVVLSYPFMKSVRVTLTDGSQQSVSAINPFPMQDDWALLPDGTVAVVRAQDYHIDWVRPDRSLTSTPKLPFAWRRITADEKVSALDSVKAMRAAIAPPPAPPGQPARVYPPIVMVDVSDLPDYYPPIRTGQTKADPDGNVWILPSTSSTPSAGIVYDVVNRKGELFERVAFPKGCTLVGFGPRGLVYMYKVETPDWWQLVRAHVNR